MISQGDINENDIDSRFYALIWIQVSIFREFDTMDLKKVLYYTKDYHSMKP